MYLTPSHKKLGAVEKRQRLVSRETWPNAARPASPSGQRWKQGKCNSVAPQDPSVHVNTEGRTTKDQGKKSQGPGTKDQGPRTQGRSSPFDPLLSSQLRNPFSSSLPSDSYIPFSPYSSLRSSFGGRTLPAPQRKASSLLNGLV